MVVAPAILVYTDLLPPKGQADIPVEFKDKANALELKWNQSPQAVIVQIRKKHYHEK